jgi:hypothetical protein
VNRDPDLFQEPGVGLSLRKPSHWNFIPAAWSPAAILKRAPAGDVQREWARHAKLPICWAQGTHASARHAKPTLQVMVRPTPVPNHAQREALLEAMATSLVEMYGARVEDATPDAYLDGRPGIRMVSRFALVVTVEGESHRMACLARTHVVFHRGFGLTIGLSGPQNKRYFREADFDAILASVSLD